MIGFDAFAISLSMTKDHVFQYSMDDDHNSNNKKNNMADLHVNPTTFKNIVLILGTIDHHELTMEYWWSQ